MAAATIYDVAQLLISWNTNKLLFFVSLMVLIVTTIVGLLQLSDEDSFQFHWMLLYIAPLGLLAFGQMAGLDEFRNHILQAINQPTISSVIPGISSDYRNAAETHYISMLFPFAARAMAWLVEKLHLLYKSGNSS
jgi:hypothetical protein